MNLPLETVENSMPLGREISLTREVFDQDVPP